MAAWHPLMQCTEVEPGAWMMVAQYERPYAVIRLVQRGTERRYRTVTWALDSSERELIGYHRTLRAAAEAGYSRELNSHGVHGPPNGRNDIGGAHGRTTRNGPSVSGS